MIAVSATYGKSRKGGRTFAEKSTAVLLNTCVLSRPMPRPARQDEQRKRWTVGLICELGEMIAATLGDDVIVEILLNPDGRIWLDSQHVAEAVRVDPVMELSARPVARNSRTHQTEKADHSGHCS